MENFQINSKFLGYNAKEDITNLPPGYLVPGSQNVLTNEGERVGVRQGYTVDGQENTALAPIESSFDWVDRPGAARWLRAYDDELEYRYVDSAGAVTWRRLADGFTSVAFNFATFWDNTELIERLLFVNGASSIYDWSGAITTFASATVNTITKEGTTTWAEEGFYTTGTRQVVIDGITYTYTGGESTTTLTGVTPDPTLGGHSVGDVIHQAIRTTANTGGLPAAFENDLIDVLYNYVYVGSFKSRTVYVSAQNSFISYTFSTPRTPGQGALLTLDATPVAFKPQEDAMYISAGSDQLYKVTLQLSDTQVNEVLFVQRLKTSAQQGAQSQAFVTKNRDSVAFLSNYPTIETLGRIERVEEPQNLNISDSVKNLFDVLDFTGGSIAFFQDFIYVAVPAEGLVLMYNEVKGWWEAPQILPISRFAIIDGALYGHSSSVPETYKLFDGFSDRSVAGAAGNPIDARAHFSYQQLGDRVNKKNFNEFYTEGYISANTTMTLALVFDYFGHNGTSSFDIAGTPDQAIIFDATEEGSLGVNSLGVRSLNGRGATTTDDGLGQKLRIINTMDRTDFYEYQPRYSSNGVDQRWELLAFGPGASKSVQEDYEISV